MDAKREIHCTDFFEWEKTTNILPGSSFVTSLPDISEFNLDLENWKKWFISTAQLILKKTPKDGVTIFFQTDIKKEGRWIDKAFLIQRAAFELEIDQLFHKIVCRVPPGIATKGKPAYSHLLCFSKDITLDPGKSTADVLSETGSKTWERGMGVNVSLSIGKFLKQQILCETVINPFCGEGSMLAAANYFDMNAIGIERSPKRAEKAQMLVIKNNEFIQVQE
jgi:hypothetical protein